LLTNRAEKPVAGGVQKWGVSTMNVYVIRHGVTIATVKAGHKDFPLRREVLAYADWVVHVLRVQPDRPDDGDWGGRTISSDLPRAYNTASFVVEGLSGPKAVSRLRLTEFLREVDFGEWGGHTSESIQEAHDDYKENMDLVFEGGESLNAMKRRVLYYVKTHVLREPFHRMLLVCHAGPVRALLSEYAGIGLRDLYRKQEGLQATNRKVPRGVYRFQFQHQTIQDVAVWDDSAEGWKAFSLDHLTVAEESDGKH
jgi:alpha-ribazole phosphatase/probable phosphoglycerate mutase